MENTGLDTILYLLITLILHSLGIAAIRHPGPPDSPWAKLLAALGRVSLLRFQDAPGTLHLPGAAQPPPSKAPEMPPVGALAGDLYAAYRAVKPVAEGGARIPEMLISCPEPVQEAWRGVAAHVRRITGTLALLVIMGVALASCSPAQTAAARLGAARAGVDLGLCAVRSVSGLDMRRVGQDLMQADWRKTVGDVTGLGIGCILHALVTGLTQAAPGDTEVLAQIQRLAESCGDGRESCSDPARARAAILLLEAIKAGRVILPAKVSRPHSGEG